MASTEGLAIPAASRVEEYFLSQGPRWTASPEQERIRVVTVPNYVVLGQLAALRFLEWAGDNPEGVAALPTGRTPEYFIKWVQHYLAHWDREAAGGMLVRVGLGGRPKPPLGGLRFVQLDEFFPIRPDHERSFAWFVRKFYLEGFGLDPARALLIDAFRLPEGLEEAAFPHKDLQQVFADGDIDLGLRFRQPVDEEEELRQRILRRFDAFCEDYERRIRALGGIGFFLGGIGPDGHVAFNIRGTSHYSTTRLDRLNYESQAAASTDLGGIDAVRRKAVITIGLGTITYRPDATAIILAAGEAKAPVVADALENPPGILNPASCLQSLPNARFYLTAGASSRLKARRLAALTAAGAGAGSRELERLVIDGGLTDRAPVLDEAEGNPDTAAVTEWALAARLAGTDIPSLVRRAAASLKVRIARGLRLPAEKRFLHTAPHHDDIELAYFPAIHHLVRSERHTSHFCYLTSGFTAVTNPYLLTRLRQLAELLGNGGLGRRISLDALRDPATAGREITGYLNAIAGRNQDAEEYFTACRLARFVFAQDPAGGLGSVGGPGSADSTGTAGGPGSGGDSGIAAAVGRALDFVRGQIAVLEGLEAGRADTETIQGMKGWIREWEAELVWAHFGLGRDHVHHLRLSFYTGAIFPEDPDFEKDVMPILRLLERVEPDIVTVAMDPEGSGPDTHFKVLVAVSRALEEYVRRHGDRGLRIYGYRNIWSRYHPAEADLIIPVSMNSFAVLDSMFNSCFVSQRAASFPSPELNGTFSQLAQKIWVEQHNDLTRLLGSGFWYGSPHPMMRRAYGAIYLKDMSFAEFKAETAPLLRFLEAKRGMAEDAGAP